MAIFNSYVKLPEGSYSLKYGGFHPWGVSQNGWFITENPMKMDDLGVPLFQETTIGYMKQLYHTTMVV